MNQQDAKIPSLRTQSSWLLFAKVVGFGFAFVLPLIVVRVLTKDQVGLYQQSFIVLGNAVAVLPFGFAMSAFYYLSREEGKRASAILNIILVHFVLGAIACALLFFFPEILGKIFKSAEMERLAPLIGVAIWLWLFSMFLETVAVANRESRLATAFIVFAQFSKTALMIAAVVFFVSVEAIIWAAIIQGALQTIILVAYLIKRFPQFWTKFDWSFFREHLIYAVPFGIAGTLWTLQTDIHYYFVGNRFSEAELAIYKTGCFQLPLVTIIAESVRSVLIPRMSELQLVDDRQEMIRVIARAMQKLAFFFFPVYVFLTITSHTFIKTLFTRNYLDSEPIFLVFLILMPFHILISDPIIRAYEKLGRFLLVLRIFSSIFLVGALYYGIQNLGLTGIIAIVVAVRIGEMFIAEIVTFFKIGIRKNDFFLLKDVGKTAIASLLAGVATYFVYHGITGVSSTVGEWIVGTIFAEPKENIVDFVSGTLILGICFAVYSIIYLAFSNLWGLIDEEEKDILRNGLEKAKARFSSRKTSLG